MKTVTFRGEVCTVEFTKYRDNNRTALGLICEDGEIMAVASVNLPVDLPAGHIFIKDWSENEGIFQVLIDAGVVEDTGKRITTGFVQAVLAKLLVEPNYENN